MMAVVIVTGVATFDVISESCNLDSINSSPDRLSPRSVLSHLVCMPCVWSAHPCGNPCDVQGRVYMLSPWRFLERY